VADEAVEDVRNVEDGRRWEWDPIVTMTPSDAAMRE
jgi:hypothetical protein